MGVGRAQGTASADGRGLIPAPGEIWYAFTDAAHRRPVIIVSREELNRGGYVTIVPVTSKKFDARKSLPNCVPLFASRFGLQVDSTAQAENITLVAHSDLDIDCGAIGELDRTTMRALIKAIGHVIASDCEPA